MGVHVLMVMVSVEYISSLRLAISVQTIICLYILIRVFMEIQNELSENIYIYIYIEGNIIVVMVATNCLLYFAQFGLIRWRKVMFYETYTKYILETK